MRILLLLILSPFFTMGQKGSYIGITANTGIYKLYNYNDWHTADFKQSFFPKIEPQKTDLAKFNNFVLGVNFGHSFNDRKSIEFNLSINQYRQNYRIDETIQTMNPAYADYFTKLKYITFNTNWYYNFIRRSKSEIAPSIYIMGGIQASYLLHYFEHYFKRLDNNVYQIFYNDNGSELNQISFDYQPDFIQQSTTENIFSSYLIGVNLGVGVVESLTNRINIRAGFNLKYDLNNVENLDAEGISFSSGEKYKYYGKNSRLFGTGYEGERKRKSTHNIYCGFGFSLSWYLHRQGY